MSIDSYSPKHILIASMLLACFVTSGSAEDPVTNASASQRVFWTESRVVGFPDPPPPFHVQRAFAKVDLPKPLSVAILPGTDELLVTVHAGGYGGPGRLLQISRNESKASATEFLKINEIIYGIAFHPNFATNGFMYVGCNGRSETLQKTLTRVLRFKVSRTAPFECDPASQTLIIEWLSGGHNGGDLVFGHDGMLYVSAGDGTSDSDAKLAGQDLSTIPGSMIRIDVDHVAAGKPYSIPPDNPFLQVKDARPEIWAYGLRNPWRISVDAKTGHLWAGNNGQDQWETVHIIRRGENYGWSVMEGSHPFQLNRKQGPTPVVPPTLEHPHSEARSLTGGHVYHGSKYPTLAGHYVYGDYSTGMIWAAKYDGTKIVSHFLVARTSLQISGFGIDHDGELLIVDHGSGLYRLTPNQQDSIADFPRLLSQTGIYKSVKNHDVDPGLVPYQVNAPLWSDGAEKERFIGLPGNSTIGFKQSGSWEFPDGAVLVKTFSLPLASRKSDRLSRIETRLMTRYKGEWYGYSYEWNEDQTDAALVEAAGKQVNFIVSDDNPASTHAQSWYYPSRSDCMVCHSRAAKFVLGLSAPQLNRNIKIGTSEKSQLDYFQSLSLFHSTENKGQDDEAKGQINEAAKNAVETANSISPSELPSLADPSDGTQPLEKRVRSYLHANCAHCHVNAGGGNSNLNLAFDTPLDKTGMLNVRPQHDSFGIEDARLVATGHPGRSLLLHRLHHRGWGQMPPLASSIVDRHATQLISVWIQALAKDANLSAGSPNP